MRCEVGWCNKTSTPQGTSPWGKTDPTGHPPSISMPWGKFLVFLVLLLKNWFHYCSIVEQYNRKIKWDWKLNHVKLERSSQILQVKETQSLEGSSSEIFPAIKDPHSISNSVTGENLIGENYCKTLTLTKEEPLLRYIKNRKKLFLMDGILLHHKFHEF